MTDEQDCGYWPAELGPIIPRGVGAVALGIGIPFHEAVVDIIREPRRLIFVYVK